MTLPEAGFLLLGLPTGTLLGGLAVWFLARQARHAQVEAETLLAAQDVELRLLRSAHSEELELAQNSFDRHDHSGKEQVRGRNSRGDPRAEINRLREELVEAHQLNENLNRQIGGLKERCASLEHAVNDANQARQTAEFALQDANSELQRLFGERDRLRRIAKEWRAEAHIGPEERVERPSSHPDRHTYPQRPAGAGPDGLSSLHHAVGGTAPGHDADDLTRIKGVGPKIAQRLHHLGITSFRQVALWSEDDVTRIDREISRVKGRIRREGWVRSARDEHLRKYGEQP